MNIQIDAEGSSSKIVARKLAGAIHEHRLSPGMKLNEDELSGIYGVSRTIIRAALQELAHMHLVSLRRNRGAFVAQPSVKEAREVFEARAMLEPRMARYAAARITDSDIASLRAHIAAEHAALRDGDNGRALQLSGQFHIDIAKLADQVTISEFVTQLVSRSSLIIALYWQRKAALCESHAHDALLGALTDRDGAEAEEVMKSHLVDLLSALDLRAQTTPPQSLREALRP